MNRPTLALLLIASALVFAGCLQPTPTPSVKAPSPLGAVCVSGADCASGFCTNGYCAPAPSSQTVTPTATTTATPTPTVTSIPVNATPTPVIGSPSPTATPTPPACGQLGAPCCAGGACNGTGLACAGNNVCIGCGDFGQSCCPGGGCLNISFTCTVNGSQGLGCWRAACSASCTTGTNSSGVGFANQTTTSCQNTVYYNYCTNNSTLFTYTCNGTVIASNNTNCTYGCGNSQCLPQVTPTPTPSPNCTDTDGGFNVFTAGNSTGPFGSLNGTIGTYADYCFSNTTLSEFFCTNSTGYVTNTTYICGGLCTSGHC